MTNYPFFCLVTNCFNAEVRDGFASFAGAPPVKRAGFATFASAFTAAFFAVFLDFSFFTAAVASPFTTHSITNCDALSATRRTPLTILV